MRRMLCGLALSLMLSGASHAQDGALRAAAQEYLENPVTQQLMDDMMSADMVMMQMRASLPDMPPEDLQKASRIIEEALSSVRGDMEAAMVEAATASFTLQELTALNEFYSSREGASAMTKMQPFMADYIQRVSPAIQQMQMQIMRRMAEEFQ